jgi:8-oxo-dGTP pyrophosphatase MutT (NUDIX family)
VTQTPAFRVLEESTVATGGFLALAETRVVGPDESVHQRFIVRHPGAVVVVPVDDDREHAFLVRQYRAAVDRELLEIPAGKRDVDGEPPITTAHRELEEEVGRRAGTMVPLAEFYNSPGFCDEYTYLYCALDLEELPERRTVTAEEHAMTIERIALANVDALIAAHEIVDAKTIIGLLLARSYLVRERAGA